MRKIIVNAFWDNEACVWVASSDDVPGLVTEAETAQELERKVTALIPELLEENGLLPHDTSNRIPFQLHSKRVKDMFAVP